MSAPAGVALLAGHEDEPGILGAIEAAGGLRVVRRCADVAEVLAAGSAGVARFAVVDGDDPDLDAQILQAMHAAGLAVVVLAAPGEGGRMLQMGADASACPAAPEQVADALAALLRDRSDHLDDPAIDRPPAVDAAPPASGRAPGRLIVTWGSSGAPGRSTVAAGLAGALAQRGMRTVLLDADTAWPSQAQILGMTGVPSALAVLARNVSRGRPLIDGEAGIIRPHPSGIGVVTGLDDPTRWREVPGAAVGPVLRELRARADAVVVDVAAGACEPPPLRSAPDRDDVLRAALGEADVVVAVGRGDVVGLNRLVRSLRWLDEDSGISAPPTPVVAVNRVGPAASGSRPRRSVIAALSPFLTGRDVAILPEDARVARDQLLGECPGTAAETPWATAVRGLARHIVPAVVPDLAHARIHSRDARRTRR